MRFFDTSTNSSMPSAQLSRCLPDLSVATVRSERLLDSGWFDADALSRLAEDHIAGRRDHARELWQLVMLERNMSLLSNN